MNDQKKASLAIFLSIMVVLFYTSVIAPPPPVESKAPNASASSTPTTATSTLPVNPAIPTEIPATVSAITAADYEQSESFKVETKNYLAEFSLLGGRLKSFKLKNYKQQVNGSELIELINTKASDAPLGVNLGNSNDTAAVYSISGATENIPFKSNTFSLTNSEKLRVKISAAIPSGQQIDKTFEFDPYSYLIGLNVNLSAPLADGSPIVLNWAEDLAQAGHISRYNQGTVSILDSADSVKYNIFSKAADIAEQSIKWIGFGDNYFGSHLIAGNTPLIAKVTARNEMFFEMKLVGGATSLESKIYAGPKDPEILKETGYDLFRSINLGWFAFVGQPILMMLNFSYKFTANYGLAIIIVTLIIKLLLLPLTKTSFISMKALQDIQPEMAELRERVKDQALLQQEMLALYKRKGVNPMGGCLPVLLQMPIFLGMYNALSSSFYLRHADFALWINDLSIPEKLMILGIPVPVMILLMGASMFLQTYLTPNTSADPAQRKMMLFMPLMFTVMFIILPFPSGLTLYWLVNNLISITQQYALKTERDIQPFKATIVASVVIYGLGYLLTII